MAGVSEAGTAHRRWLYWLPALAVMVLIFALSAQSGLRVSEDAAVEKPLRVTGHLLAFGTLSGLLLVAISWGRPPRLRDAALALGITVVYGLTDELHQSFVPDRTGRLDDVVTDTIGALAGLVVAYLVLTLMGSRNASGPQGDSGSRGRPASGDHQADG